MKDDITMNKYQENAESTAIYPNKGSIYGLCYTALGLGEAGEVQNKVKKLLRDDYGVISEEKKIEIAKELGGNLWYIAMCAKELNYSLGEIAILNLQELASRKERNVLQGSGDNR
jgi:NTP pyrophosphatase (non-canonical NTP hydrolase)